MKRLLAALLFAMLAAPVSAQVGQYAEDSAHVSGHFMTPILCVRRDTPTSLVGADNDYIPCTTDSAGRIHMAGLVTQSGTWNIGTVTTLTSITNTVTVSDPTFTDATGTAVPANAAFVAGTDGTNTRALKTDAGGELQVDVLTMPTTTVDSELPAAAALADAAANPTTPMLGANLNTFNGTTWDRARGDTTNGLDVDVTRLPALVAGTANIGDVDVASVTPVTGSGVISALNAAVTIAVGGYGAGGFQLVGTCTTGVVTFEGTIDGTNWSALEVFPIGSQAGVTTSAAAGIWVANIGGLANVRTRVSDACDANDFTSSVRATTASARMFGAAAAGGTSSSFGAAFPASGTASGFSDGTNMQGGRAVDTDTGAGTVYVQGVNLLKRASGGPVEAGTSTDPLRTDPTGTTTQPVSAASLPLPTGATTLAEQQTQTTALQLIDNLPVTQGSTTSGQSGALIQGAVTTTAPTYTTAQTSPLSLQTDGDLRVEIEDPLPAGTNVIGALSANQSVNTAQINGVAPTMGNGVSGTGVQRVTLASDSTGQVALAAGSATIGALTANQSVNAAQVGGTATVSGGTAGTLGVGGAVAHDTAGTSNPVVVGAEAIAYGADPTVATAGRVTKTYANRDGVPFFLGGHMNTIAREVTIADADGAQTGNTIDTVAAGNKIVVTYVVACAAAANTVALNVRVAFSTTTTLPTASLTGVSGVILSHPGLLPGACTPPKGDGAGIVGIGADDEDLRYTVADPVGGSIRIVATYFKIES